MQHQCVCVNSLLCLGVFEQTAYKGFKGIPPPKPPLPHTLPSSLPRHNLCPLIALFNFSCVRELLLSDVLDFFRLSRKNIFILFAFSYLTAYEYLRLKFPERLAILGIKATNIMQI